jgi:predicted outer membrane protein
MRGPFFRVVAIGAGCVLCAFVVSAQAGPSPTPTPLTSLTTSPTPSPTRTPRATDPEAARSDIDRARAMDRTFMTRAQLRALEQLELGRIVAARSSNAGVRSLAQLMVEDRGKTSQELKQLAETQGIDLPAALDTAGKADIERVSRLSSPELDRAYVERTLRTQDADVADFEAQTSMGQEVELQAWVWNTLPLLKDQQERIRAIASELGIKARSTR